MPRVFFWYFHRPVEHKCYKKDNPLVQSQYLCRFLRLLLVASLLLSLPSTRIKNQKRKKRCSRKTAPKKSTYFHNWDNTDIETFLLEQRSSKSALLPLSAFVYTSKLYLDKTKERKRERKKSLLHIFYLLFFFFFFNEIYTKSKLIKIVLFFFQNVYIKKRLVLMVAFLEKKMFISTVSSECNCSNAKSRKHCLEVGWFWENRVFAPGFTLSPRVVVNRYLYLCFDVWFYHLLMKGLLDRKK